MVPLFVAEVDIAGANVMVSVVGELVEVSVIVMLVFVATVGVALLNVLVLVHSLSSTEKNCSGLYPEESLDPTSTLFATTAENGASYLNGAFSGPARNFDSVSPDA